MKLYLTDLQESLKIQVRLKEEYNKLEELIKSSSSKYNDEYIREEIREAKEKTIEKINFNLTLFVKYLDKIKNDIINYT